MTKTNTPQSFKRNVLSGRPRRNDPQPVARQANFAPERFAGFRVVALWRHMIRNAWLAGYKLLGLVLPCISRLSRLGHRRAARVTNVVICTICGSRIVQPGSPGTAHSARFILSISQDYNLETDRTLVCEIPTGVPRSEIFRRNPRLSLTCQTPCTIIKSGKGGHCFTPCRRGVRMGRAGFQRPPPCGEWRYIWKNSLLSRPPPVTSM